MKLKTGLAACLLLLFTNLSFCQTIIWAENFNGYTNGTTLGSDNNAPTGADWFSGGCPSCVLNTSDWWEIRSGQMEARDVNNDVVFLQTENIDISGWTSVQFNILCSEQGDHDGIYLTSDICADQNNEDFADIYYSLDGGPWTKIINYLGWCGLYNSCGMHSFYGDDGYDGDCRTSDTDWESVNLQIGGLSGTTLALRMEARNSAGTEYIRFDNIVVQGFLFLPVELLSFSAKSLDSSVQLDWITASEQNNEQFYMERSYDAHNFEKVGEVLGAGNSQREIHYEFIDDLAGLPLGIETIYYRLKQVDTNGSFSFSDVVAVRHQDQQSSLRIYPNPAKDLIRIEHGLALSESCEIRVINSSGQVLSSFTTTCSSPALEISLEQLDPGLYILSLHSSHSVQTEKFLVR